MRPGTACWRWPRRDPRCRPRSGPGGGRGDHLPRQQGDNAASVGVAGGSTVGGSLQVKQGRAATVTDTRVDGDILSVEIGSALRADRNVVGGDVQAFKNTGGLAVSGNRIDGNLQCKENSPPPTGGATSCRATRRTSAQGCDLALTAVEEGTGSVPPVPSSVGHARHAGARPATATAGLNGVRPRGEARHPPLRRTSPPVRRGVDSPLRARPSSSTSTASTTASWPVPAPSPGQDAAPTSSATDGTAGSGMTVAIRGPWARVPCRQPGPDLGGPELFVVVALVPSRFAPPAFPLWAIGRRPGSSGGSPRRRSRRS